MTVRHIIEQLGLRVWAQGRDQEVREGYVSDLLSDAIAHADEGSLWITVQRHINVVAVAQLKKIAGIIISRGLEPEAGLRTRAEQEGIFVLGSSEGSFAVAGKLFALLRPPR